MTRGVLLMTYGSPADDLHDLADYLTAVRGGRAAPDELVAEFRRRYKVIGGSPLIPITRSQAEAVERLLRDRGVDARATVGMRFSEPSVATGLRELADAGCDEVAGIIMSPQYSGLLMGGYERAIDSHVKNLRQKLEPNPRQPRYVVTVYGVGYKLQDDERGVGQPAEEAAHA